MSPYPHFGPVIYIHNIYFPQKVFYSITLFSIHTEYLIPLDSTHGVVNDFSVNTISEKPMKWVHTGTFNTPPVRSC